MKIAELQNGANRHSAVPMLQLDVMNHPGVEFFFQAGSFGIEPMRIGLRRSVRETHNIALFIHGLYGLFDPNDTEAKANDVAQYLSATGAAHVVQYSSSRLYSFPPSTKWQQREAAFLGKTFSQELDDLRAVLSFIFRNSSSIFGIEQSSLRLLIHGSSLGGTLAILAKEYFPIITRISLCGSGCGANTKTRPVLSTIFPEDMILSSIATFRGQLLLIQGSDDTVVPKESGQKIIRAATSANAHLLEVPGANHTFTELYGVPSQEARAMFERILIAFLRDGDLPTLSS